MRIASLLATTLLNGASTRSRLLHRRTSGQGAKNMIDNLALAISHGLLMLTAWLLMRRPDLDREPGPKDRQDTPSA